jgi:hypothetical protein
MRGMCFNAELSSCVGFWRMVDSRCMTIRGQFYSMLQGIGCSLGSKGSCDPCTTSAGSCDPWIIQRLVMAPGKGTDTTSNPCQIKKAGSTTTANYRHMPLVACAMCTLHPGAYSHMPCSWMLATPQWSCSEAEHFASVLESTEVSESQRSTLYYHVRDISENGRSVQQLSDCAAAAALTHQALKCGQQLQADVIRTILFGL